LWYWDPDEEQEQAKDREYSLSVVIAHKSTTSTGSETHIVYVKRDINLWYQVKWARGSGTGVSAEVSSDFRLDPGDDALLFYKSADGT
jgi:hypothetical protein